MNYTIHRVRPGDDVVILSEDKTCVFYASVEPDENNEPTASVWESSLVQTDKQQFEDWTGLKFDEVVGSS